MRGTIISTGFGHWQFWMHLTAGSHACGALCHCLSVLRLLASPNSCSASRFGSLTRCGPPGWCGGNLQVDASSAAVAVLLRSGALEQAANIASTSRCFPDTYTDVLSALHASRQSREFDCRDRIAAGEVYPSRWFARCAHLQTAPCSIVLNLHSRAHLAAISSHQNRLLLANSRSLVHTNAVFRSAVTHGAGGPVELG